MINHNLVNELFLLSICCIFLDLTFQLVLITFFFDGQNGSMTIHRATIIIKQLVFTMIPILASTVVILWVCTISLVISAVKTFFYTSSNNMPIIGKWVTQEEALKALQASPMSIKKRPSLGKPPSASKSKSVSISESGPPTRHFHATQSDEIFERR